jgi:TolB-like protein/Tfp pilus assembly protein PilF
VIGRTLAHYRITAAIGAGGMGQVFRATDTKLGREVALKILPKESAANPEMTERFKREARAVAALNHPNVVTIYSVEEADGLHFLTMELVAGRSLDRLIPEGGLETPRILEIAKALSGALAEAHDKGIVHRDLKPANVMVTDDGSVKVLDFGLAKFQGSAMGLGQEVSTAMQTDAGVVMGTRPYMSPEQVQGRTLDHRTDIFSLGVLLYETSTGKRPFHGQTGADLFASILRDPTPPVKNLRPDLPGDLVRVIGRCLEKDPQHRLQTARDVGNELRDAWRSSSETTAMEPARAAAGAGDVSGPAGADEGFRVAVLPLKYFGTSPELNALAEGLSEEIVTGLSRFSYLRVMVHGSTKRQARETVDLRAIGKQVGARYVMDGSVRQAGSRLRVSMQLADAETGAHLWAENYERTFSAEAVFEIQDDLVPRIVSTVADQNGVLTRRMSEALRSKGEDLLTPHEAVLRAFTYFQRVTPEEHAVARRTLERATGEASDYADGWAMLSLMYAVEFADDFNPEPDPLDRALTAAQRAVHLATTHALGHYALAFVYFLRKENASFRAAAERALALNPMDGSVMGILGLLIEHAGESERGCQLVDTAMQLNPNFSGLFRFPAFMRAYDHGRYAEALELAVRINMPNYFYAHAARAAALGQLGQLDAAKKELRELLTLRPDFAAAAHRDFSKWYDADRVEHMIEGLSKAGLGVAAPKRTKSPSERVPVDSASVAIAVLPFSDLSPGKDQEYLCEGMAEEVMGALMGIEGLRVASRTSTFRARQDNPSLGAIARVLSVSHVLEGSVRTAGDRLRVVAQLTDVATGFQLWAERFDRDARDIFAVQDEIAAGVVGAVKARLKPGAAAPVPARSQVANLEAYRHYLQGRHLRYSKNDHAAALRSFEAALALDPSHAPSMVDLAEARVLVAIYGLAPTQESYAAAKTAIDRAAGIEGETSEGLHVLGLIAVCERDWSGAEQSLERALVLDPGNVRALCWLAIAHVMRGRLDQARVHLARAREIDPLAPYPYAMSGWVLLSASQTAEAFPLIEQALAFDPDNSLALWTFAMALVAQGRAAEAIPWAERAVTPSHRTSVIGGVRGWVLASAGRVGEAREVLESLRSRPAPCPTLVSEGWILAALGDREAAFAILEKAADQNQALVAHIGLPPFDALRSNPRFGALVKRMGLDRTADQASPVALSSSRVRADEGFWVAVLPFKSSGSNSDLAALAEGLSEEIVTGLSRFTYLRMIARGSTSRFGSGATDIRAVGKEIGARYVMEGSLRQAGARLRVAVQLTDAATGAHLWAETYDRPFHADDIFALQDDLVPRIVSTVADQHGVLPHSMSGLIRNRPDDQLGPVEAVLRVFSFHERMSPEEHRRVRALLERTVRDHPGEGDCWAMLATLYADEYMFGFEGEPDPLRRAQATAQRAVETAPTSWLAAQALAQSLFFRREWQACRPVAERTIALNPMDSATLAFASLLLALSGAWDRGLEVSNAARNLNPHYPGWYWLTPMFHAYHRCDYRATIDTASRFNMPGYFWVPASQAAAFGQLGETEPASKAVSELLLIRPDFAVTARGEIGKYFDPELLDHFIDGLRKAGLEVPPAPETNPKP